MERLWFVCVVALSACASDPGGEPPTFQLEIEARDGLSITFDGTTVASGSMTTLTFELTTPDELRMFTLDGTWGDGTSPRRAFVRSQCHEYGRVPALETQALSAGLLDGNDPILSSSGSCLYADGAIGSWIAD